MCESFMLKTVKRPRVGRFLVGLYCGRCSNRVWDAAYLTHASILFAIEFYKVHLELFFALNRCNFVADVPDLNVENRSKNVEHGGNPEVFAVEKDACVEDLNGNIRLTQFGEDLPKSTRPGDKSLIEILDSVDCI
jgi:hypothetical protein